MSRVLAALCALVFLVVAVPAASAAEWTAYDRPAEHAVVTDRDVAITVRDGTVLRANVQRPDAEGAFPVIVTQTPYNKDAAGALLGGGGNYFVERGYVVVTVDVRGTGASQGTWDSFGEAEQRDGYDVVEWAAAQPWSSGSVGTYGPSYMGLNQLLTAAQRPPHLKAIFPIVPMADGYRDIVFSGGELNVSFIPLWLGLVAVGSVVPSPDALVAGDLNRLVESVTTLLSHVGGVLSFDVPTVVGALTGGDTAYDGPFWKTRSPLEVVDRIQVPTFVVGGHHDLFQRGEPLIYERLKRRVPTRLLMGPWTHIGGSRGEGLPRDGVPTLEQIALRWFDRYLLERNTNVAAIPYVTQYVYGQERYETQADWPDPRLEPRKLFLRGDRALAPEAPAADEPPQRFLQQPLSGICTQSTAQWTAGLGEAIPCTQDNRLDELGSAVYTTPPLTEDLDLSGPVLANVWIRTTAADAAVTVRVTDVDPATGASRELTTGWLAASLRAVDPSRSRYVDGELLQPWHPFTRASAQPVIPGVPTQLPVEIFPLRATIKAGHALRITVSPADFPHSVPPLPRLLTQLGGAVQVLTGPRYPSSVTLPGVGECAEPCEPLPVPQLIRG